MSGTTRTVTLANHLWDTLDRMSRAMGTPRDALLNQAIYAFARSHGFPISEPGQSETRPIAPGRGTAPAAPPVLERSPAAPAVPGGEARPAVARKLVIRRDDGSVFQMVGHRFVIGRGSTCDLVIDSPSVSREHAVIVREGAGFVIEDLGSSNGTWYQKRRIDRQPIADGDEVFVGSERLRFAVR